MLTALATAGKTIGDYSTTVTGFGKNLDLPSGTPTTWVVPSINKLNQLIDFECDCVNAFGDFRTDAVNSLGENRSADETVDRRLGAGRLQLRSWHDARARQFRRALCRRPS